MRYWAPGSRLGAPVFTIETKDNNESWAFLDGIQTVRENGEPLPRARDPAIPAGAQTADKIRPGKFNLNRSQELQAYADAIIEVILEL